MPNCSSPFYTIKHRMSKTSASSHVAVVAFQGGLNSSRMLGPDLSSKTQGLTSTAPGQCWEGERGETQERGVQAWNGTVAPSHDKGLTFKCKSYRTYFLDVNNAHVYGHYRENGKAKKATIHQVTTMSLIKMSYFQVITTC